MVSEIGSGAEVDLLAVVFDGELSFEQLQEQEGYAAGGVGILLAGAGGGLHFQGVVEDLEYQVA